AAERIEPVAAEISRVTPEIGAAEKDREPVNGNQPNRERFKPDARFTFLALNGGVHLLHVRSFSVISSLTNERRAIGSLLVHFVPFPAPGAGDAAGEAGGAAAGEAAGATAGEPAAAGDFTSLSGCD